MLRTTAAEPQHRNPARVYDWYETEEKPVGGFARLTVHQVLLVTWARTTDLITPYEFRVWWAAVEVNARRIAAENDRDGSGAAVPSRFDNFAEWSGLLGGAGGQDKARRAFKKLHRLGLLTCTRSKIRLIESPDQLRCEDLSGYWRLVEQVGRAGERRQPLPVPRSLVRLIAGGVGRGVAATMVGVLLRCLRRRKLDGSWLCVSGGLVSATWIAEAFGVGEATVKHAFKHLQSLGWMTRLETPQWVQQRHGGRTLVNLAWSRPADEPAAVGGGESTPRTAEICRVSTPPLTETKNSFQDKKTRNPVPPDRTGFSSGKDLKKPSIKHVVPEDLRSTPRLLTLFEQAAAAGLVQASDYDRLRLTTAAEHAVVKGTRNACGLFMHIVRNKLWHFCTNDDEDAAVERLKRHFFGDTRRREPAPEPKPKFVRIELSDDAKLAAAATQIAAKHRVADPFYLLKREKPDWTRERWGSAVSELEAARLRRLSTFGQRSVSCGELESDDVR